MASHKIERASQDIKRELTDIFREVKDPRVTGMLSIVNLDLTNDYSRCTVYISSLEGIAQSNQAVEGLNSAAGFIRREIGQRLSFRRTPEFVFIADDGIEYSAGIHKMLLDLDIPKDEETPDED